MSSTAFLDWKNEEKRVKYPETASDTPSISKRCSLSQIGHLLLPFQDTLFEKVHYILQMYFCLIRNATYMNRQTI